MNNEKWTLWNELNEQWTMTDEGWTLNDEQINNEQQTMIN